MTEYKNIIDSHFHTHYMKEKGVDTDSLFSNLFQAGFMGGIDAGCSCNDIEERVSLLKDFPLIHIAGAMGPWESGAREDLNGETLEVEASGSIVKSFEVLQKELDVLKSNIEHYKIKIIGEIGLDYYWKYGTKEKQFFLFEEQMKLASSLNCPVLIHNRDASEDTESIVKKLAPPKGGIIHCFSGDRHLMETSLDRGFYISFAGNVTYKSNKELREVLKEVPLQRLLLETDSPYLSPVPFRGKLNNPSLIVNTYECVSQTLGLSLEVLKEKVLENYLRFLSTL